MSKSDQIRLSHMLDAAREALGFATGRSREDLERDRLLNLALVRLVEIFGEAARQVSEPTRARFVDIPWLDISDMRNRLAHGYAEINHDLVWDVVANRFPNLLVRLEQILEEMEP